MAIQKSTRNKLYIALGIAVFLALLLMFLLSGENYELLKSVFNDNLSNDELRDKLMDLGWRGYITVTLLAMLQVAVSFLPAEPVQVVAGLAFGFPVGLLCCWAGVFVGSTLIFLLQKTFGDSLRSFFVKKFHLDLEKIANSSKCVMIVFILYFLPAIPYGMICFFAASTGMRYRRYVIVTMLGALPSVCIGVGLGHLALASSWVLTLCLFVVLVLLLIILAWKRNALFSKINDYAHKHSVTSRNPVQKVNPFVLNLVYWPIRFYAFLRGVHVKPVNKVGKLKGPAIVLCNHGSFVDFIFASTLLRKSKPHFVAARLYFYDKRLRWLLKKVGAFPKSMFAMDTESTKNCIKVLRDQQILAMMPEARLSTVGRFEDIQESTYSFIKKSAVPVYTVKFNGDYFADPKWGKGFRRGSVVEAELDILYTAEQVQSLSVEELKQGVEDRLRYDDFAWLKERPQLRYRSKYMAEGLENILTRCPVCGGKHTITTQKDKVFCEKCGYLTSLDDRYAFTGDFQFENFAQWYDWQKDLLEKEISENPDFVLSSSVELRLPSDGKGLTRSAGSGVCTLNREGMTYRGTKDGEEVEIHFPLQSIYRLLFGAGVNFEIYNGQEILFFVPEEKRSAVDWYVTSILLRDSL